MTHFKFIHAADLHLDTPFRGISATDTEISEALRDASLEALTNIVDEATSRRVDFVLFAGDIYDGAERGVRAQLAFQRALQRLDAAGIRAFIIHGNHDPLDGWSAIREFPTNTRVFSTEYEAIPFAKDGDVLATIHGVSYGQNHVKENLSLAYQATGEGFQIGLLHCEVGKPDGAYAPCSLRDLERSGLDYWALGHIHAEQVLCDEPRVVYPGNTQGRSFNEEGARGVRYVEVREGKIDCFEFVEVDSWRFVTLEIDVSDAVDVAELIDLVEGELETLVFDRAVALRIKLTGATEAYEGLVREGVSVIEEHLRDATSRRRPRVWLARVENKTRPKIDIDEVLERDDFGAEAVRCSNAHAFVPEPSECIAAKYRRKLDRYLGDLAPNAKEVKDEALSLALEQLLGGN